MISKDGYGIVERTHMTGGSRLHESAFHHRQHESGELRAVRLCWQCVSGRIQPTLHTARPLSEIPIDERTRVGFAVADFQGQVADRTSHAALMLGHPGPVVFEQDEHTLERIRRRRFGRCHHHGLQIAERKFQHLHQQIVLAGQEVVHAAGIHSGLAQNRRDTGCVVPLLVKELERRAQQPIARLDGRVRVGLSDHSSNLNDRSNPGQGQDVMRGYNVRVSLAAGAL